MARNETNFVDAGFRRVVLAASAVHTQEANAVSAEGEWEIGAFEKALIVLDITASATIAADTLDVYIDVSWDEVTWLNAVHFTQQAGDGAAKKELATLDVGADTTDPDAVKVVTADAGSGVVRPELTGRFIRVRSTVVRDTGVDESHTFSVVAYVK